MKKQKDEKRNYSLFYIMRRVFPLVTKECPGVLVVYILVSCLLGVVTAGTVFFRQGFFDAVTDFFGKNILLGAVLTAGIIFGAVLIIAQILESAVNLINNYFIKRLACSFLTQMYTKSYLLDPIDYENPETLVDIEKANPGSAACVRAIATLIGLFSQQLPSMLIIAVYLYSLRPLLVISLLFVFIPVAVTQYLKIKIYTNLENENAPLRRELSYYSDFACESKFFKETRQLGCFGFFYRLFKDTLKLLNKNQWKTNKKVNLMEFMFRMLTFAGYAGVIYLLFDSLMKNIISVGAFAAVFYSIGDLYGWMQVIVEVQIGQINQEIGNMRNYISFLDIKERGGAAVDVSENGICADNISFQYPQSDTASIKNISLDIAPGETIALVGENGAGKSTLVKLLTGLYLPDSGTVKIGGHDTKQTHRDAIYKNISGVFQQYQRYQMTLAQNFEISDIEAGENDYNRLSVTAAKADINPEAEYFTEGFDTMLSRNFGGIDLSGGQWQRVAIGRGFYRNHNIIVLDEPTAAIDPIEETKLYKKFNDLSAGKTSIIVTHRLGSARIADRIVVMDDGEIVEIGSHDELVVNDGLYSKMWHAQAQYYV